MVLIGTTTTTQELEDFQARCKRYQTIAAEVLYGKRSREYKKNTWTDYLIDCSENGRNQTNYMYQNLQMGANILREQIRQPRKTR